MAFVALPTVSVGDPVTKDLFDKTKANFDDLDSRVTTIASGTGKYIVLDALFINASNMKTSSTLTNILTHRATNNFTLTTAILYILDDGSSGTAQFDLLKSSTLGGTYTSVFSTKPALTAGGGDNRNSDDDGTPAVFSTTAVTAGEFLRVDITGFQVPVKRMHLYIIGEL